MTGTELGSALRGGRRVYGTLIVSDSPRWLEVVPALGLDFVFIDTEHVAIDRKTLGWMCQAYRAAGLPALVRTPAPDPYQAAMVLDAGACGVIAPYVESPDQVRALCGAVKLRPLKGRKLQSVLAGKTALEPALREYLGARNAANVLVVNVESVPALESLDGILAVDGLDAVLIGPHDLSCSLGIPEQYGREGFDRAVRTVIGKARGRGVGVGIHYWADIQQEIGWARAGANLIVHEADIMAFRERMGRDIRTLREALGDAAGPTPPGAVNV